MVIVERVTRILFALLFGWVLVLLAFETRWRRHRRIRRTRLEEALAERPQLRPTVEMEVPGWRRRSGSTLPAPADGSPRRGGVGRPVCGVSREARPFGVAPRCAVAGYPQDEEAR
jgi:hypothetical protein